MTICPGPRLRACAVLLLLSACGETTQPETPATVTATTAAADIAITNITAIDTANGVREGVTVYTRDDQIIAVTTAEEPDIPADQSIDGRGRYLIPGLWDMHVHITYEPELTDLMPLLFLDYGVTSVRDTGGMLPELLPEIEKWRAADSEAPRIFFSGPLLDGAKVVYDGNDRPQIGIANANPGAAAANVAQLHAAGVDFIKIYELVSPEVFAALTAAAQQHGLPIASHVPLTLLADQAGPAVGTMEHLRNVELACASNAEALLEARRARIAAAADISGHQLRSSLHADFRPQAFANLDINSPRCQRVIAALRNTIQVPTLRLNTIAHYSPLLRDDWLAHLERLPAPVTTRWQSTAQRFLGEATPDIMDMVNWSMQLTAALQTAGVPIGAGTDTPIGQAIPGYSLHTELERLVEAGLSPMQALHAATVQPAEFLDLADTYGRIEPGYVADLVILSNNPLDDIRHSRGIEAVISRGRQVR